MSPSKADSDFLRAMVRCDRCGVRVQRGRLAQHQATAKCSEGEAAGAIVSPTAAPLFDVDGRATVAFGRAHDEAPSTPLPHQSSAAAAAPRSTTTDPRAALKSIAAYRSTPAAAAPVATDAPGDGVAVAGSDSVASSVERHSASDEDDDVFVPPQAPIRVRAGAVTHDSFVRGAACFD